MGGPYLSMAEAVEAYMSSCTQPKRAHRPYWQLHCVGQVRLKLRWKMQLKARPNIQPQGRGFESRLCHTELISGNNGVGQHWWGICPGYVPQWLGEICCERGMPRVYEQPLLHCLHKKNTEVHLQIQFFFTAICFLDLLQFKKVVGFFYLLKRAYFHCIFIFKINK